MMNSVKTIKTLRTIRLAWVLVLAMLLIGISIIHPAFASNNTNRHAAAYKRAAASTPVTATIYVTLGTIQPMFQNSINQDLPPAFNAAITSIIDKLPQQDRIWAVEMATTLIQPSATLQSLTTQQNGLAASILIALYPNDPKPSISNLLISFGLLDSSTIQVTGTALGGGPALASGPLSTFQIPFGTLTTVNTTPTCGDSALALNMQLPVSLTGQTALASPQAQQGQQAHGNPLARMRRAGSLSDQNTFVEVPATSIAAMSGTFGSMSVGNGLTADNIRASVQNGAIQVLSDIYWNGINVGTADSTLQPGASNGSLVMSVTSTNFNLFGFIPINENSYDQQIEQTINSMLGPALAGKFTVSQAQIGPPSQLPCAKSDSLVLTGTASI